jgi:hypothetical protein
MPPKPPGSDCVNGRPGHPIGGRKIHDLGTGGTNGYDVGFCKYGLFLLGATQDSPWFGSCWMRISNMGGRRRGAPLTNTISHIFSYGPNEQMVWARARRIVAFVKDLKAMWDRSGKFFVGKTMSAERSPRPKLNEGIATVNSPPAPRPAPSGVANYMGLVIAPDATEFCPRPATGEAAATGDTNNRHGPCIKHTNGDVK